MYNVLSQKGTIPPEGRDRRFMSRRFEMFEQLHHFQVQIFLLSEMWYLNQNVRPQKSLFL